MFNEWLLLFAWFVYAFLIVLLTALFLPQSRLRIYLLHVAARSLTAIASYVGKKVEKEIGESSVWLNALIEDSHLPLPAKYSHLFVNTNIKMRVTELADGTELESPRIGSVACIKLNKQLYEEWLSQHASMLVSPFINKKIPVSWHLLHISEPLGTNFTRE